MVALPPMPLSPALLARYRLRTRQQYRTGLLGGHLTRRKGQSLDFRDFEHYTPGDDIRHVDWRASARIGGAQDWLVRGLTAEERLTLAVSIDTRTTMALPRCLPKMQVAFWLAEAIATVALNRGDQVLLHRLFGGSAGSCVSLGETRALGGIRRAWRSFAADRGNPNQVNVRPLLKQLPPPAVWVSITDLDYPDDEEAARLASQMAQAQDGLRWVILGDLDSWPGERHLLGVGPRQIEGPYLESGDHRHEIDAPQLDLVAARIAAHKRQLLAPIRRKALDCLTWSWWEQPDPSAFFRDKFLNDRLIRRLFMRER